MNEFEAVNKFPWGLLSWKNRSVDSAYKYFK